MGIRATDWFARPCKEFHDYLCMSGCHRRKPAELPGGWKRKLHFEVRLRRHIDLVVWIDFSIDASGFVDSMYLDFTHKKSKIYVYMRRVSYIYTYIHMYLCIFKYIYKYIFIYIEMVSPVKIVGVYPEFSKKWNFMEFSNLRWGQRVGFRSRAGTSKLNCVCLASIGDRVRQVYHRNQLKSTSSEKILMDERQTWTKTPNGVSDIITFV